VNPGAKSPGFFRDRDPTDRLVFSFSEVTKRQVDRNDIHGGPEGKRSSMWSARTELRYGGCSGRTKAMASPKRKIADFEFYATVEFIKTYLLKIKKVAGAPKGMSN
jgi:hypothetical protein